MADLEEMTPGQILADTNVATFIENMGLGIARAQRSLDQNSLETAVELASTRPEFSNRSLLELGFNPTFYHYQHADLEVSLQITMRVERSTSVHVGLTANVGHSTGSTTAGQGTATISVRFGSGAAAIGVVRLSQPGTAELTLGATRLELVNGSATAPNVAIVANSLRGTALALADMLGQTTPSDAVPEVRRATVQLVEGGTSITPTTDASSVFAVGPNRIEVLASGALPARAWVTIAGAGAIDLVGSDNVNWTATPSPEQAATSAIDAHASYNATLLFQSGKSLVNPRFQHNSDQTFETSDDERRMLPWIEFLRANSTIRAKLVGHADRSGEDSRNDPLSLARANRAQAYLVAHGVPATQLDPVEGRGEREPLSGHTANGVRDPENRRVELHLVGDLRNVVFIETQIPGPVTVWGSGRPTFVAATAGRTLAARDGTAAVAFADGTFVAVATHHFYVNSLPVAPNAPNHVVTVGATAESAARTLAAAILTHAQVDAYAEGRVVRLLPTGSHALIRMESTARDASANSLALNATGSLTRESPFAGASAGGEPTNGDTIRLGTTTLTCRATAPAGTNEFVKGADAAATATNLASAISAVSGYTGSANAERVTVTGPGGSALTTSNPGAFELSGAQLSAGGSGNPPTVERREQNTTVAAGLSLDVSYARRFGVDVTGNSRIATRLVSIPAPVELLDEIRTFLNGNPPLGGNAPR